MAEPEKKPVQKDRPLSLPVILMALGGALVFFPWMGDAGILTKLIISAIGLAMGALGFFISK
jgi:hypothetical protein